ncbi:MAG: transporter [Polynucleobacter sp.]|nr:MAG: transporter [Polynucleobacter sp.]
MKKKLTHILHTGEEWLFANPKIVLGIIFAISLGFASLLPNLRMGTDFEDLLPQSHPFIQLHNEIKDDFGGASAVVVSVEVKEGDIFTNETLALIDNLTQGVDSLSGVNHNLVSSLTHRTSRKITLDETGNIKSALYFDPSAPKLTPAELEQMKRDVMANPRVYGLMVSPDLKSAIIKGQMNEGGDIDYRKTFAELSELRAKLATDHAKIHATGLPVLTGWVYTYLNQILQILLYTAALIFGLLVVYFRRFYGVALPLLGICLSSAWGLGFMTILGYTLDPLSMPIPFLIAARATSHGVQLVERYYYELELTKDGKKAARNALDALFRPGSLAITIDAIGIFVICLGAAPINIKLGYYAGFWGFSVIFTVHFMVPLFLTILPAPKKTQNNRSGTTSVLYNFAKVLVNPFNVKIGLIGTAIAVVIATYFMSQVKFGESEPGSPILNRTHDYNISAKSINEHFPGSEELFVVARTKDDNGIQRPEVVHAMEQFGDKMMVRDPELGGYKAIPGLIRQVNMLTHSGDPRWAQIPDTQIEVAGLMSAYELSSPIPGAMKEFMNPQGTDAVMSFFYKDHQATTLKRIVNNSKEFVKEINGTVENFELLLGGGIIGVSAAIDEENFVDTMIITPVVMIMAFIFVMFYYESLHAGWLMVLPMLYATILTYGYMGFMNIGISVNTIPVIAVGVGVGIDYAVYIMDRIREEYEETHDLRESVLRALSTTGLAVGFTAATLIAGVIMWVVLSDLRFQSDAALLLTVMLALNAVAAVLLVPAWVMAFKPKFITAAHRDADGILQNN